MSNSLHVHLTLVLTEPKLYMMSYIVYFLVAMHPNYPRLTKKGNMQELRAWSNIVYF